MSTMWSHVTEQAPKRFNCGFCGSLVGAHKGYAGSHPGRTIYICPNCSMPVLFDERGRQHPLPAPGQPVKHLPEALEALYDEARRCVAAAAPTAAVLACRKLLMNIGVAQGAPEGATFIAYVDHLSQAGFVPPNGRHWVDHIRKKGNEANHEIALMSQSDAEELIDFIEMLLKFVYEFPNRVPKPS